jgi:hypothetical protein
MFLSDYFFCVQITVKMLLWYSRVFIYTTYVFVCQWPSGLRRSSAARLLRSCVRIPPGAWMFVVCCQVEVSATDLSLVQRSPAYCDASFCEIKKPRKTRRLKLAIGLLKIQPQWFVTPRKQTFLVFICQHYDFIGKIADKIKGSFSSG